MGVINSHNPSNSQHAEHHVLETDGHISEQSRDGGNADHSQSGTSSLFRLLNNLNLFRRRGGADLYDDGKSSSYHNQSNEEGISSHEYINKRFPDGQTLLTKALRFENDQTLITNVKSILKQTGIDINYPELQQNGLHSYIEVPPIIVAAKTKNKDLVELLLESGASVNAQDSNHGCFAENLVELATRLGATTLVNYAATAGLAKDLTDNGPFTIFAPTNAAFDALPAEVKDALSKDTDLLKKVLMFHVLDGLTYSSQLSNDLVAQSLDANLKIRINIYGKTVTADGAKVTVVDQNATNGVIHVIDHVMFPLPTSLIPETAAMNKELSTLLYCVSQAQLVGPLSGSGPFTVFAPSNQAFDVLPPGALSDLLSNFTALVAVLKYHVVQATDYSAGLSSGPVQTLEGGNVNIQVSSSGVKVNEANVITANIPTSNGVIHIIDKVLLPK